MAAVAAFQGLNQVGVPDKEGIHLESWDCLLPLQVVRKVDQWSEALQGGTNKFSMRASCPSWALLQSSGHRGIQKPCGVGLGKGSQFEETIQH